MAFVLRCDACKQIIEGYTLDDVRCEICLPMIPKFVDLRCDLCAGCQDRLQSAFLRLTGKSTKWVRPPKESDTVLIGDE